MHARTVDAGRGVAWFGEGWRAFMHAPAQWIAIVVAMVLIGVVLNFIPIVGWLALSLVTPGLVGGMLLAARESLGGRPVAFEQLFAGLTSDTKRNPMLVLGTIMLAVNVVLGLVMTVLIGGTVLGAVGSMGPEGDAAAMLPAMGAGLFLAVLVALVTGLGLTMALIFAVPLVMFTPTAPLDAIKASIHACLRNIPALLVFGLLHLLLTLIAAIPLGLGFLVLMPVTLGAVYAAYQDVFGEDKALV